MPYSSSMYLTTLLSETTLSFSSASITFFSSAESVTFSFVVASSDIMGIGKEKIKLRVFGFCNFTQGNCE